MDNKAAQKKGDVPDNGHQSEPVAVTARDVLLGRGNLVNNSAGNQMFRSLIRENAGGYVVSASRTQKELIARQILQQIRHYGGRFMRQVGGSGILPSWEVVSDEIAASKVRQALRDMAQQLTQDAAEDAGGPESEETDSQGFASIEQSPDETDLPEVDRLLQQIHECRQESAEQLVRLRALLVECETSAARTAAYPSASLGTASLGRDVLSLSDSRYARALQAHELQEELDQLRRRQSADLTRGEGLSRLIDSQRYREDELLRRAEEAAFRQYQSLLDYQQSSTFRLPDTHGLLTDSSGMDRSLLSLGLSRRGDSTSLDHMLRGSYPESMRGSTLLTPAGRQIGSYESQIVQGQNQGSAGIESGSSQIAASLRECTGEERDNEEAVGRNGPERKRTEQAKYKQDDES